MTLHDEIEHGSYIDFAMHRLEKAKNRDLLEFNKEPLV